MKRQLWPVDRIDSVKGAYSMDTETGFGLSTIGQIAIAVKNLDEQTAFENWGQACDLRFFGNS
jgi:hypothetical protein